MVFCILGNIVIWGFDDAYLHMLTAWWMCDLTIKRALKKVYTCIVFRILTFIKYILKLVFNALTSKWTEVLQYKDFVNPVFALQASTHPFPDAGVWTVTDHLHFLPQNAVPAPAPDGAAGLDRKH